MFPVALEGALKLKEISYIQSLDLGSVTRTPSEIDWSPDAAEKGGYEFLQED